MNEERRYEYSHSEEYRNKKEKCCQGKACIKAKRIFNSLNSNEQIYK